MLLLLVSLYSCNKWLDLKPADSIIDDKLYEDEAGYKQALTGAYIGMINESLYGRNLLVGINDAMAQYWKTDLITNQYHDVSKFDFKTQNAEAQISVIWTQTYAIIANLNELLERLNDPKAQKFENYNLIKGEALGLRAFLHFDLLRLFGPVLKNGGISKLSIPYRQENTNKIVKRMTGKQVLTLIEADLIQAYKLLKDDPILKNGRKFSGTVYVDKEFMAFEYRAIRMNHYAVAATLARVYMYQDKKTDAYKYAKLLIDAKNTFQLLSRDDIIKPEGQRDLMFESEIIFGLYDAKLKTKLGDFLGYSTTAGKEANITVDEAFLDKVYIDSGTGKADDYRRAYWWKTKGVETILNKYYRDLSEESKTPYDPILPLIRLSEMYYIAAESKIGVDNNEAINLLNTVREHRNIDKLEKTVVNTDTKLLQEVVAEYRKEFWGEGQMFYTYKRLFMNILSSKGLINAKSSNFVLPLPKEEYEFGNN